jgi:hypothetical protein
MSYLPIENQGITGNRRTAALVGMDGAPPSTLIGHWAQNASTGNPRDSDDERLLEKNPRVRRKLRDIFRIPLRVPGSAVRRCIRWL